MLELNHLCYSKNKNIILHDISIVLYPGKIYALLGVNGSGKTTLLKVMAQIWPQTAGSLKWQGVELRNKTRKEISQLTALVAHNHSVAFGYSVSEIVAMGGYASGLINNRPSIENALKKVDAWHLRDRPITQISNGERQRVFIARALMSDAPVIFLDEPTTGLDVRQQNELLNLFKSLRQEGKLLVVSSHDFSMIQGLADEVILLHEGCCRGFGLYEKVMTSSALAEVFGVPCI